MTTTASSPVTILELSERPTIKGKVAAHEWYRDVMGLPITRNEIETRTASKELPSFWIGGALWFSTQDLYNYVMAQRRTIHSSGVRRNSIGGAA
jgi:hypothetical protein